MDQRDCLCKAKLRQAEIRLQAGLPFDRCFDDLAEVLRCAGVGACRERVDLSDRAGALVIRLLKRG